MLKPLENTKPFFKAAFQGFAGSGKTYTMVMTAIGLHKRLGSTKPIVIFDTEKSVGKIRHLFAEAGVQAQIIESRSLKDLKEIMAGMDEGYADVMVVDSITHVWENLVDTFLQKKGRDKLQFQDFGVLYPLWKKEFSDPFVNGSYHALFTGRAGNTYGNEINEETGKREIYADGFKMKAGAETAYEPDMLVHMERVETLREAKQGEPVSHHLAKVIKDRSALIDGQTFLNPKYADFEPAIARLLDGTAAPRDAFATQEGDTAVLIANDDQTRTWQREKDAAKEKVEALLTRIAPGNVGKDKVLKIELMEEAFGTTSQTELEQQPLEALRAGYRKLMDIAVARSLNGAVYVMKEGKPVLTFTQAPAPVASVPSMLTPSEEKIVRKVEKLAKGVATVKVRKVVRD